MTDADMPPPFDRVPLGPPPPRVVDELPPKVEDLPPLPTLPPPRAKVEPSVLPAPRPKPEKEKPAPKPEPVPTPVAATPAPKPRPVADTARDLLRPNRKLVAGVAGIASIAAAGAGVYLTSRTQPTVPAATVAEAKTKTQAAPTPTVTAESTPATPKVVDVPHMNLPEPHTPAVAITLPLPPAGGNTPADGTPLAFDVPATGTNPAFIPPSGTDPRHGLDKPAPAVAVKVPDLHNIPLPTPGGTIPPQPEGIVLTGGQSSPPTTPSIPAPVGPNLPPPKDDKPAAKVEPVEKPKDPLTIPPVGGVPVIPVPAAPSAPLVLPQSKTDTPPAAQPKAETSALVLPNLPGPAPLPDTTPKGPPPVTFIKPADTAPPAAVPLPKPGFNEVSPIAPPPAAGSTPALSLPKPGFNEVKEPITPAANPALVLPAPKTEPTSALPSPPAVAPRPSAPVLAPPTGPAGVSLVKPAGATDVKTDFDVDLHEPKASDTYESISKLYYGDTRFAGALRAFNRSAPLGGGRQVEVPPASELRKRYGGGSDRPVR